MLSMSISYTLSYDHMMCLITSPKTPGHGGPVPSYDQDKVASFGLELYFSEAGFTAVWGSKLKHFGTCDVPWSLDQTRVLTQVLPAFQSWCCSVFHLDSRTSMDVETYVWDVPESLLWVTRSPLWKFQGVIILFLGTNLLHPRFMAPKYRVSAFK